MDPKLTKLGRSLPVPSVQELVKKPLNTVPPHYVRRDLETPVIFNHTSLPEVPVIDMSKLISKDFMDSVLEKFHHACKEWGFFQSRILAAAISCNTIVSQLNIDVK
ncbi:hypothetical protein Pint_10111 [Pistacia integerrima]|uniref:Uncharacterized protein n=1 Tax=Pistacia integerrima TaxID=434235 RepID=A0ACC0XII8_9ROSI|nr:hypothetical protein Pint_10111 [Pistacia integerrima]